MKKISLLLLVSLFSFSVITTSCSKDEEEKAAPSLSFSEGVSLELDFATADSIRVDFSVDVTAEAEVETFTITEIKKDAISGETTAAYDASTTSDYKGEVAKTYSFDKWYKSTDFTDLASVDYKFEVADKDGKTASKTYTLTMKVVVIPTYDPIYSWTAKLLGAQSASAGSFLASSTGTVYSQGDADANAASIDISYGVLASGGESFISPSERGTLGFTAVTNGTITNFALSTITTTAFDAMTNDSLITNISTPTETKVTAVVKDNVYEFVNAAGKKGLIKVASITSGNSGNVTIDVKVQQ